MWIRLCVFVAGFIPESGRWMRIINGESIDSIAKDALILSFQPANRCTL